MSGRYPQAITPNTSMDDRRLALKYVRSIRAQYGPPDVAERHSDEFEHALAMGFDDEICGVCKTLYRWHLAGIVG